jgi:flagellar hook-associated protein 1 FlgK
MSTSLDSITARASSGLRASQAGIAVLSDNIANAGVAGYTAKHLDLSAFDVGGQTNGVRTGLVSRSVDAAVQTSMWSSASTVGALTVRARVLDAVNATQGTPGDGTSIADAVAALQHSFTLLQAQPSGQTQQAAAAAAAGTLAGSVNNTANAITRERNGVQSDIVTAVGALNSALDTVQSTTSDLIRAVGANQDTAGLEDRRDAALQTLSGLLNVHYDKHANGDITILGQSGFAIPLTSRFSTGSTVLSPASSYAAGGTAVPPVMMQSANAAEPPVDVTSKLSGGQLGELIQLRDKTLPGYTASLDTFSAKLSSQFASQGLQLFTDGTSASSPSAYAGLSAQIQVNPAVVAQSSMIRDGTPGSTFPINPAGGPAGFPDLINRVLKASFSASAGGSSLSADAQGFVSQQSAATGKAKSDLAAATSYQTAVAGRFADGSGVNVDQEMGLMIQLQNSYQANARVVQATQTMFTALLDAVRTY